MDDAVPHLIHLHVEFGSAHIRAICFGDNVHPEPKLILTCCRIPKQDASLVISYDYFNYHIQITEWKSEVVLWPLQLMSKLA